MFIWKNISEDKEKEERGLGYLKIYLKFKE